MSETDFEKWIREKEAKRKKPKGREFGRKSSTLKKKASVLKLAKQPTLDPKEDVKPQTVEDQPKSEESIIAFQDPSTQSQTEMSSGTAPISAKVAMRRLRSRRRREQSKREGILNS